MYIVATLPYDVRVQHSACDGNFGFQPLSASYPVHQGFK